MAKSSKHPFEFAGTLAPRAARASAKAARIRGAAMVRVSDRYGAAETGYKLAMQFPKATPADELEGAHALAE
jgi:hypothetical protein